jgi:SWI/SNF-related matrix-associated actin-dependent regulator 1 of chromatin subfamily A
VGEEDLFFPYQIEGSEWLKDRKVALLADEMGLGKSAQVIRASDLAGLSRILILCPAALRVNWEREFKKFSPTPRKFKLIYSGKDTWDEDASIICSYDLASHAPPDASFDALVLDEAHFLKSAKAKRTVSILGKGGIARRCKRIWALTGTPMPNNASELWPLMFTFGATRLSYDAFVDRYCTGYRQAYQFRITGTKPAMFPELKSMVSNVMLRRKSVEVKKDLPDIVYIDKVVEPGPVDLDTDPSFIKYTIPAARRAEFSKRLKEEEAVVQTVLNRSRETRSSDAHAIRQLEAMATSIATLRRYLGLQKVMPVAEFVKSELEQGLDKIVLFAWHQAVIEGLMRELKDYNPLVYYGPSAKQKAVDRFQNDAKYRVFIANILSAGAGLTLTASAHVAFVESSFSPSDMAQAVKRCHRIGQTRPVFVRFFSVADSIDERVTQILKRKTREVSQIFG